MNAELVEFGKLDRAQRDRWRGFQQENPSLASPYFTLEFAELMARTRYDTRTLILHRNGTAHGFLPLHVSRLGVARPLAGPLGDHHAIITNDPSLDFGNGLSTTGVSTLPFSGALACQTAFSDHAHLVQPSWVVDVSMGYEAFLDGRRSVDAKAMRNIRARARKLEQSGHDVVYRIDDRRPEAYRALMEMKRDQYRRTGAVDVFVAEWARILLDLLFETHTENLSGCLSTMEIDGKLAAAHFGMHTSSVMHYWFPVYDNAYSNFGPGLLLFLEMARVLENRGIHEFHLGPGDYDFKKRLANASFDLVSGQWSRPSLTAAFIGAGQRIDRIAQRLPLGRAAHWPGKALRRLDTLAAIHGI